MTFRVPGAKNARLLFGAVLAIAAIGAASCGGGDDEPTAPSGSGVSTATFTIAVGGQISPTTATINRGDRVTFVNNDTVPHTMSSNPHPNRNRHRQSPIVTSIANENHESPITQSPSNQKSNIENHK